MNNFLNVFFSRKLWLASLFIIVCFPFSSNAQGNLYRTSISVEGQTGTVLPIFPGFPESDAFIGGSITLVKPPTKIANLDYNKTLSGLTFTYQTYGNSSVLGSGYGLQYQIRFPFSLSDKLTFSTGLALGGAYFDSPYHKIDNSENIAVGNALGFLVSADAKMELKMGTTLSMILGGGFHHTSNGHTYLPNVGLNIPYASLGLRYSVAEVFEFASKDTDTLSNKWQVGLRYGWGVNELGHSASPTNGPKYFVYLISAYFEKRLLSISRFRFGVEAYYSRAHRDYLESIEENPSFADGSVLTFFLGHEFLYSRWGLLTQLGFNPHNPGWRYWTTNTTENKALDKLKVRIPGKFGVNYYFLQPFFNPKWNGYLGLYIKSNMLQADYLETTMGINF